MVLCHGPSTSGGSFSLLEPTAFICYYPSVADLEMIAFLDNHEYDINVHPL